MRKVNRQQIINDLAEEYDLPKEDMAMLVKSQFQLVKDTMKEGNFDSVRLPRLGIFQVNPTRLQHLKEHGHR